MKPLVFDLMRLFEAESLGMVLITRIPAGGEVKPHVDVGWHAQHYLKFALQLKSAPGQKFCYEGTEFQTGARGSSGTPLITRGRTGSPTRPRSSAGR